MRPIVWGLILSVLGGFFWILFSVALGIAAGLAQLSGQATPPLYLRKNAKSTGSLRTYKKVRDKLKASDHVQKVPEEFVSCHTLRELGFTEWNRSANRAENLALSISW